jgi:dienelactone hydrolase
MKRLPALLLLLPLAAPAAPPIAGEPIPVQSFIGNELLAHPKLSPDGKHIVMATRMNFKDKEVRALAVHALPGLKHESVMPLPPTQVPINFYWVSNTRLVVERGFRQGSRGATVSIGEVLAVDVDGKRARYLFGQDSGQRDGYGYVAGMPVPLNGRALLGDVQWDSDATYLQDVDALTGNNRFVTRVSQAHARFTLQNDGFARFARGRGAKGNFQLWRRDGADGDWRRVPEARTGAELVPAAFSVDDTEFFAYHSATGGPHVLVAENVATGARRVVAADPQGSISAVMKAAPRDTPFAAVSEVGVPRVHYLKPDSDRDVVLHRQLAGHFKDAIVEFIDASDGGGKVLFSVSSDRDPGVYYLFDRATGKADMLFARMEAIDPERMAARLPITFTARDGETLHGFLTVPAHAPGSKVPLVLIPHEGPYAIQDTWHFDSDAQFLASRGYATLQVNFRGSSGRGPAFERAGFGQWRGKVIDDLVDGIRWAGRQEGIDAGRMCVFGTGFGAFTAMTLASRETAMVKCAIGYSGIYDIGLYGRANFLSDIGSPEHVERFVGDQDRQLEDLSPTAHARSIEAAVLLIHGGKDSKAVEAHAERMRSALRKAGREPEWYFVDDEGHGFHRLDNQAEVYRRLEAFLAKHLGK